MVGEVRQSRLQAGTRRATSVLAVLLLAGAGAWLAVQLTSFVRGRDTAPELPRIACSEVEHLLGQYGHGVLAETLEARIAAHLDRCQHCRNLYRKRPPTPEPKQTSQAEQPFSWLARKDRAKT
jgi:hypothetical protein